MWHVERARLECQYCENIQAHFIKTEYDRTTMMQEFRWHGQGGMLILSGMYMYTKSKGEHCQ